MTCRQYVDMAKMLFWLWLLILLLLNVIPIGNETNKALTDNRIVFRLDYLIHFTMMLFFAIIWGVGKRRNVSWFAKHETLKYCGVLLIAGIGLELLQLILPWRTFNPMDLLANFVGAVLAVVIIIVSKLIANLRRVKR